MNDQVEKDPNLSLKAKVKKHDYLFLPLIKILPMRVTPNQISAVRFVMALPIIILIYAHLNKTAGIFFLIAALLDALDGSMARLRNQETKIGAILDPTADKAVNFTVFLGFLFWIKTNTYLKLTLTILLIDSCLFGIALVKFFIKDVLPTIDTSHESYFQVGIPSIVHNITIVKTGANHWGKIKMMLQVIVLSFLLLFDPDYSLIIHQKFTLLPTITLKEIAYWLMFFCIIFGVLSLYGHLSVIRLNKEAENDKNDSS